MSRQNTLRLNAVGVGRDNGIRLPAGGFNQSSAEIGHRLREHHQVLAVHGGIRRRQNVLTRTAGMQHAGADAASLQKLRFKLNVKIAAIGTGLAGLFEKRIQSTANLPRESGIEKTRLGVGHDGCTVDLLKPVFRIVFRALERGRYAAHVKTQHD